MTIRPPRLEAPANRYVHVQILVVGHALGGMRNGEGRNENPTD
jgi:hypothetical protein